MELNIKTGRGEESNTDRKIERDLRKEKEKEKLSSVFLFVL